MYMSTINCCIFRVFTPTCVTPADTHVVLNPKDETTVHIYMCGRLRSGIVCVWPRDDFFMGHRAMCRKQNGDQEFGEDQGVGRRLFVRPAYPTIIVAGERSKY